MRTYYLDFENISFKIIEIVRDAEAFLILEFYLVQKIHRIHVSLKKMQKYQGERTRDPRREWPGSWLRSQQLTIFNGDWMSASLSANRRVMLTSGQTDNGRALNAHGARSIPWIRRGIYWGSHPAITVNDGTYETLFSRRVCSLHTSCKYSVTPDLMVNGADVRVTPVCKPTHPKPIWNAKRERPKSTRLLQKFGANRLFLQNCIKYWCFLKQTVKL